MARIAQTQPEKSIKKGAKERRQIQFIILWKHIQFHNRFKQTEESFIIQLNRYIVLRRRVSNFKVRLLLIQKISNLRNLRSRCPPCNNINLSSAACSVLSTTF